jgi:hypothetical protein
MAAKNDSKEAMDKARKKAEAPEKKDKEKKEKRSVMPVIYAIIVIGIAVVGIGAYLMMGGPGNEPVTNGTNATSTMNLYQRCARLINEGAIKGLVSDFNTGTDLKTYIMTLPPTANCSHDNGTWVDSPYSIELGDGYLKTTMGGSYVKSSFKKGIVVNNLTIPEEDVAKGVFIYVTRTAPGKLSYAYELKDKSKVKFDAYDPQLAKAYALKEVPTVVWNCKQAVIPREDLPLLVENDTGRQLNTSEFVVSEALLGQLTCVYNHAKPVDVCSRMGVTASENGSINFKLPSEIVMVLYTTAEPSCRPDNDTVKVQAFYTPDCPLCERQRAALNKIKDAFGDAMDLTYYCVGNATESAECRRLIAAQSG